MTADTEQRKQVEELRSGENRILEMIAKGAPLPETLTSLLLLIEAQVPGLLGSIVLLDEDERRIRHGAAPSLPESYSKAIDGVCIGPQAGSCGTAMYRRAPVIVSDIKNDPLWEDYQALADAHGLRACWSTPIFSHQGRVLGSFAMYYREVRLPGAGEMELIEMTTSIAGIAIQRNVSEAALRRSEERYRSLVENLNDVVFTLDPRGVITYVSPAIEQITGYRADEVIGTMFSRFIHGRDLHGLQASFAKSIVGQPASFEFRIFDKQSATRWVQISSRPRFEDNRLTSLTGVMVDITERRRLEDQLLHAQKMEAMGRLAGGIAHDFSNLLNIISGYAEVMQDQIQPESSLYDMTIQIVKTTKRAATLTGQLLAFSRQQVRNPSILDLNRVIADLGRMLPYLIGKDIEIVTTLAREPLTVYADQSQMEQVVLNLAVNARDAMPNGGCLMIETSQVALREPLNSERSVIPPGKYILILVKDTGVGMNEPTRVRIFEPYFTTKEIGKGTGLGLATVYGIIEQSEGFVLVQSEPGMGTTFKVYLPYASKEPETARLEVPPSQHLAGTETILLVEDEESLREATRIYLSKLGYSLLCAKNGVEGLESASRNHIDLLLTDIVMPQMSGRELADRLRSLRHDLRVIYVSGYTNQEIIPHAHMDSGTRFLQKPFSLPNLASTIREILDQPPEGSSTEPASRH